MSNILIVDDEKEISNSISEFLNGFGYNVYTVTSGTEALNWLSQQTADLILSDIKMPNMTGLEFFDAYKNLPESKARFVLMTGYTDLQNAELAYEKGIDELLAKPFDFETLKLIINYLLETVDSIGNHQDKYFRMRVEDFSVSTNSEYNLFIKLNHKFVCFSKSGQEFTHLRLKNIAQKGFKYIYLNSKDYAKYTDLLFVAENKTTIKPLDLAETTKAQQTLIQLTENHFILSHLPSETLQKGQRTVEQHLQALFIQPELVDILHSFVTETPQLAKKAVSIAVLSLAIVEIWKWSSPKIQCRLVLSSVLCDISWVEIPNLIEKDLLSLSPEEHKSIEQHPLKSYQLIQKIENFPEEILQVISQHHKNSDGSGFPMKVQKSKLHPFSKIIHALIEFYDLAEKHQNKQNIHFVLNELFKNHRKLISEQVIKSLYILFNTELPKELTNLLLPDQSGRLV